jgi:D-inositol-3-phosphate glycosyltransferase
MKKAASIKKVAMLSLHSSPVGALGSKDTGGMSVVITGLSRELGRKGIEVDIFTQAFSPSEKRGQQLFSNVRLICLKDKNTHNIKKEALYFKLPVFEKQLIEFIESSQASYDIVHSHYWLSAVLGQSVSKKTAIGHVVTFHTLAAAKDSTALGPAESHIRLRMEKDIATSCDRIIVPTDREKDNLSWFYKTNKQRIGIVPNGVDLNRFRPGDRSAARKRIGRTPDERILLFAGRFDPMKGIDRILKAVGLLPDIEYLVLVIVGGDGENAPETLRLKRLADSLHIGDRVVFAGRVEPESMPVFYCAADCLIVGSCYESFGLVGLESLACGTPVISTPVGAMDKIIESGKNGFIAYSDSPAHLADAVRKALDTQFLPPEIIHESVSRYGWDSAADMLLDEYEIAAKDKNTPDESFTTRC